MGKLNYSVVLVNDAIADATQVEQKFEEVKTAVNGHIDDVATLSSAAHSNITPATTSLWTGTSPVY